MQLYVKFTEIDGTILSPTTVTTNVGTKTEVKSSTTWLYGGFIDLLQSLYYNVPKASMGRYSSVSGTNFNFGDHCQLGYERNSNFDTWVQHSVSAFNFNFGGLMFWGGSTYTKKLSTYIG